MCTSTTCYYQRYKRSTRRIDGFQLARRSAPFWESAVSQVPPLQCAPRDQSDPQVELNKVEGRCFQPMHTVLNCNDMVLLCLLSNRVQPTCKKVDLYPDWLIALLPILECSYSAFLSDICLYLFLFVAVDVKIYLRTVKIIAHYI